MRRYVPFQLHPIFVRNSPTQPAHKKHADLPLVPASFRGTSASTVQPVAQYVFRLSRSMLSSLPDEFGHLSRLHADFHLVIAFVVVRPSHGRRRLRQSTLPLTKAVPHKSLAVFTRAWHAQNLYISLQHKITLTLFEDLPKYTSTRRRPGRHIYAAVACNPGATYVPLRKKMCKHI